MTRSNGIPDRTAAHTGRPARDTQPDHGLPWDPAAPGTHHPVDPQFAPHGYEPQQPTSRHTAPPAQLPWPTAGQHANAPSQPHQHAQHGGYPGQGGHPQAYAQPANYPPQQSYAQPPSSYAADPHHGHYFPAQAEPAYVGTAYGDPAAQLRGTFPGHAEPAYAAQHNGYGAQPGYPSLGAQSAHPPQPAHDPRAYELGAYATQPIGHSDSGRGQQPPAPVGGYPGGYGQPHGGAPHFDPAQAHQPQPNAAHAQGHEEDFDDEEFEDEEEDAPRRFGLLKVIASLAVAIGIGAGGAYAYKKFGNPMVAAVKPMAVRADAAPTRNRPGELQTASADTKAGERLNDVPAVVPANDGNSDGTAPAGARRVQTIAIPPPGMAGLSVQQPPMRPTISVPGMAVEGLVATSPVAPSALPAVTPAPAGRAVAPPPVQVQPQRPPVAPRVIAALEDPPAPPAARPAAAPKVAVPKAVKTNDAYLSGAAPSQVGAAGVATASTATTAPRATAANGYVAVLSSQSSAIDARKSLDDQQSRYADVLAGKPTDVTEFSNPRDGKTYYRAIVGPPGSRDAAATVCSQLKAVGHKDCFAAAY